MSDGRHASSQELADFTTTARVIPLSLLAIGIGILSTLAWALLRLIGFFTNVFYYGRISTMFRLSGGKPPGLVGGARSPAGQSPKSARGAAARTGIAIASSIRRAGGREQARRRSEGLAVRAPQMI